MSIGADGLNFMDNIRAASASPKDGVLVVQPGGWHNGDEELGRVRIRAHVGHGECVRAIVSEGGMELVLEITAPVLSRV